MGSLVENCSQQQQPSTTAHYSLASSPSTTTTIGPDVASTFKLDDDAAETAASFAAALSTLFKNGLGKFSSSAKSYSGEGWLLGTGIGGDLATVAAAARLELLPDNRKCGCGSGFAWVCPLDVDVPLSLVLNPAGSKVDAKVAG
jgi:hypothetical protein